MPTPLLRLACAALFIAATPGPIRPEGAAAPPPALATLRPFFGSTHNHTGCCNDHSNDASTAGEVMSTAKSHGWDWIFLTEHSGSTGPSSPKLTSFHTAALAGSTFYSGARNSADTLTDDGFVAVVGYEYSDNDGGTTAGVSYKPSHMTAVDTTEFLSADGLAATPATLMDELAAERRDGRVVFGGFNHPGPSGHPGSAPAALTPARRAVVATTEVQSGFGYDATKEDGNYRAFVLELDRGWRVAPVCGLDGHGAYLVGTGTNRVGTCRTGALLPSLTRPNLMDAFASRRLYAARDTDLELRYQVNGQWMGSQIGTPSSLTFFISAIDPNTNVAGDRIVKFDIVTAGGKVVASKAVSGYAVTWQTTIPSDGHRYFFVRVYTARRAAFTAIGAPVWLENPGT